MRSVSTGGSTASRAMALLFIFLLALLTLHRRNESLRGSYAARRLLEREARLENEVRWLGAAEESAYSPRGLLQRARSSGKPAFDGTLERLSLAPGNAGPMGN